MFVKRFRLLLCNKVLLLYLPMFRFISTPCTCIYGNAKLLYNLLNYDLVALIIIV